VDKINLQKGLVEVKPVSKTWELLPLSTKILFWMLGSSVLVLLFLVGLHEATHRINIPLLLRKTSTPIRSQNPDGVPSPLSLSGKPYIQTKKSVDIRSGPSEQFAPVAVLEKGQEASIIGTSADRQWLAIQLPYLVSRMGWVRSDQVISENLQGLPIITQVAISSVTSMVYENAPILTTLANVNVRDGPGLNYDIIGLIIKSEQVEIIGKDPSSYWWKIKMSSASNEVGWVSVDYVLARNSSNVSVVDIDEIGSSALVPTPGIGQPSLIALVMINVRNGPDTIFEIIGRLELGQIAEVIGVSEDGLWYAIKINRPGYLRGWVTAGYARVDNATNLPILK
jgi:uncharacterized protein YraI